MPRPAKSAATDAVREVEARMRQLARDIPAERGRFLQAYIGTKMPVLGLPVPVQRAALRRGYAFSDTDFADQLPIWDAIWRTGRTHETVAQALLWAEKLRKPDALLAAWPTVRDWTMRVDCWDLSDGLSAFFSRVLAIAPGKVHPVLRRWNRSRNPWLRRQSIVSLLCTGIARKAARPAGEIFPLIETLIADPDRFVQKAIGWTLRDAGTVYPEETVAFVDRHAARLSAIAFAEATRKLPAADRAMLKAKRAGGRKR